MDSSSSSSSSSSSLSESSESISSVSLDTYDVWNAFHLNELYHRKAPDSWISFTVGGIFGIIALILWYRRFQFVRRQEWYEIQKKDSPPVLLRTSWSLFLRAIISTAIDMEEPFFTIASYSMISFLLLGALQTNFGITLTTMIGFWCIGSLGDPIRVILAVADASSLSDVMLSSAMMESAIRKIVSTELKPSSIYEDLGRERTILCMVFITQLLLISFVVLDIYGAEYYKCPDGSDCRILSTMGSYTLYILGIFMACVYLLGPKTSYGQSEQNPVFWLQLLLSTKKAGAKCTWFDPIANKTKERMLPSNDIRLWARFFMSYIINGIAFHVLVYALPIQVAYQTTFTSVVLRAVGMMYLVDLDDSTGYTLTIVESSKEESRTQEEEKQPSFPSEDDKLCMDNNTTTMVSTLEEVPMTFTTTSPSEGPTITTTTAAAAESQSAIPTGTWYEEQIPVNPPIVPPEEESNESTGMAVVVLADEVNRIIEEAKAKLDALSHGQFSMLQGEMSQQQQQVIVTNTTPTTTTTANPNALIPHFPSERNVLGTSAMFLVSSKRTKSTPNVKYGTFSRTQESNNDNKDMEQLDA